MSYWTSGVRRARELGDKAREHLTSARPCSCIGQSKRTPFETDQVLVKLEECVPVDTRDQTEPQPSSLDNHNSVAHHSTNDPIDPVPHDSPQEPQTSTVKDYFHNPLERTTSPDSIVHRPPRKRAVLIGIHYYEEEDKRWEKLDVPGKDVEKVEALLRKFGYTEFRILSDRKHKKAKVKGDILPTRENIVDALNWLVGDVQKGDRCFLHYSGHGEHIREKHFKDYSETSGKDEAIVPLNCNGKYLKDDELHIMLVEPIKRVPESQLIALFDCCHSGTMLDILFEHSVGPRPRFPERNGDPTNRPKHPVYRLKSSDYITAKGVWNGGVISEETPKQERKPSLKSPMFLQSVVLPIREETLPEVIPEEPTTNDDQNNDQNGDPNQAQVSRERISVRIPDPSEAAAMVVFNATRHPSIDPSRRSTQQSRRYSHKSKQSSHSTMDGMFLPDRIMESPSSTTSTITDLKENPTTSSGPSHSNGGGRVVRALTMGQFADSPTTSSGRVYAIAACQDDECVFDMNDIGGLLTSHFVEYMSQIKDPKESTLSKLVNHLWKCFQQSTQDMHLRCKPEPCRRRTCGDKDCTEDSILTGCGHHACEIPIEPPKPLVTSLTDLHSKTVIWP